MKYMQFYSEALHNLLSSTVVEPKTAPMIEGQANVLETLTIPDKRTQICFANLHDNNDKILHGVSYHTKNFVRDIIVV